MLNDDELEISRRDAFKLLGLAGAAAAIGVRFPETPAAELPIQALPVLPDAPALIAGPGGVLRFENHYQNLYSWEFYGEHGPPVECIYLGRSCYFNNEPITEQQAQQLIKTAMAEKIPLEIHDSYEGVLC